MKIIFPMAGLGSRFKKAIDRNPTEYIKPKPFILVEGSPMITWASRSLPLLEHNYPGFRGPEDMIFIILKEHNEEYHLEKGLREIYGENISVIVLPELTRGAAETAYAAKILIEDDEEIIVSDSDHYFPGDNFVESLLHKDSNTVGMIPVFIPPNDGIPRWSYSLPSGVGTITKTVGEKDPKLMRAGAYANIGAYYFSKAKIFFDETKEIIDNNILFGDAGKGEFYIAPIYQRLINKGLQVEYSLLPEVWGLGTPDDLEAFLKRKL